VTTGGEASLVRSLVDQLFLIVLAIFAVASLVIVGSLRTRLRASIAADPRGMRNAAIAGVALSALPAFANTFLAAAYLVPTSRQGFVADYLLLPFLYLASLVSLAVLDSYAIWPARPGKGSGAVGRGLLSLLFVGAGVLATAAVASGAARVAEQTAQAEESQAVKARSAALSMVITVVDAELGASTVNGRIVSHLTLDVAIRSTTDIELRQDEPGFGYNWITLVPPGTGFSVQPEGGLGLPAHIPAGSEETYRLEVPVEELRLDPADGYTTGVWTALLFLEGSGAPGSPPRYETSSTFMVRSGVAHLDPVSALATIARRRCTPGTPHVPTVGATTERCRFGLHPRESGTPSVPLRN
jgi:hypothetical protein